MPSLPQTWPSFLCIHYQRASIDCVLEQREFRTMVSVRVRIGESVAQKVQTLFVDDLDGSAAEGTVRFGLDGSDYEIDLNAENARALRDALARYISAGRRADGGTRRQPRSGR